MYMYTHTHIYLSIYIYIYIYICLSLLITWVSCARIGPPRPGTTTDSIPFFCVCVCVCGSQCLAGPIKVIQGVFLYIGFRLTPYIYIYIYRLSELSARGPAEAGHNNRLDPLFSFFVNTS